MKAKLFQQTYTTIEQSKRLLELGLPKDTADMYYSTIGFGGYYKIPSVCAARTFVGSIDFPNLVSRQAYRLLYDSDRSV